MRPETVTEAWALNKRNVRKTIRELDGHDLGDGEDCCEISGCDEYATHAISSPTLSGWICERHTEQAHLIAECPICGALTVGTCEDDHGR